MNSKTVIILFMISFACLFSSCKSNKTGEESGEVDSALVGVQENIDFLNDVLYLYPSPGEIIEGFFDADLEYKPGLVNSVENRDSYLGSRSQALNLGIYVTDLAYSAKFGLTGESVDYLEAIYNLSSQVGVSTNVFESLLERARTNISNSDSILNLSNEAFYHMVSFLESSKKENTLAIISVGAYIESLYLVFESKEEYAEDDPVFAQICETVCPFDNLMSRAKQHEDDQNVATIIKYLNAINEAFEQLPMEESETTVTKKDGKLMFGGGTVFTLTAESFTEMKSTIRSIRTEITSI